MHLQLTTILSHFQSALDRLETLAQALPEPDWHRRPAPEGWSPLECVAHLNLTSSAFIPLLRDGLEEARRSGRPAPARYRRDPVGWLIGTLVSPRPWMRTTTTAPFVPSADRPAGLVLEEFRVLQAEQMALVRESDGLAIDRVRIASPFDVRARYSMYSAFLILPRHQQRHLAQAERAAGLDAPRPATG
jgi:hypothetical protein